MQRAEAFRLRSRLHGRRNGWSKFEILIMLGIVVIGFFVLRPVFRGAREINQLTAIGQGFGIRLLEARVRANDEKRIYACYIKPGTGSYQIGEWTGRTPDGKLQPGIKQASFSKAEHVKQHQLPGGITFVMAEVTPDQRATDLGLQPNLAQRLNQDKLWSMPILFYPDETNLPAKFILTFQDKYFVNVTLDPKTGETSVGPSYTVETPSDNKEPYDPLKEARGELSK